MLRQFIIAPALALCALVPGAVSAQAERSSSVQTFHLMQLSVNAADVPTEDFQTRTEAIRSCGDAMDLGEDLGADMTRNRFVRASQLPDALRTILEELPAGHATPVFSNEGNVLRVLVLCNRT